MPIAKHARASDIQRRTSSLSLNVANVLKDMYSTSTQWIVKNVLRANIGFPHKLLVLNVWLDNFQKITNRAKNAQQVTTIYMLAKAIVSYVYRTVKYVLLDIESWQEVANLAKVAGTR